MTDTDHTARAPRASNSNRLLAYLVIAAGMVAVVLVAVIAWMILQEESWTTSGIPAVHSLSVPADAESTNAVTANFDAGDEDARQILAAAAIPGPKSLQEIAISPKNVVGGLGAPRARWTPTPLPTSTPPPSPTPMPTFVSQLSESAFLKPLGLATTEKWIDVNVASQTLVAYEGGLPVFQSLVSTGKSQYPTVTGQFRIWLRFQSQDMNGYRLGYDYYLRDVPYVQYFYQDYALHGTFWHNNFGTPMSHGCVNLPTPAAEWLFNWSEYGTLVNVHG